MEDDLPIGIFDSGIGGLTVVNEISRLLPREHVLYIGDTARVPYGTRGKKVIIQYALELIHFLLEKKVKMMVVACNTISATALTEIQKTSPVPVIDVISPTVEKAVTVSQSKRIGVIGTNATITSRIYEKKLKDIDPRSEIFSKATPLLVPLVEEGFTKSAATELILKEYLSDLLKQHIDTLILGCTHYPLLKKYIQAVVGNRITLIDSAKPTADEVEKLIEKQAKSSVSGKLHIFLTDPTNKKPQIESIMGRKNITVEEARL